MNKLLNKKALIIGISLLLLIGIVFIIIKTYLSQPMPAEVAESFLISDDQNELIDVFGYPDTFMIVMDYGARYENWIYYEIEKSFSFLDGDFLEEEIIPRLEDKNIVFPAFKPTDFQQGISFDKISEMIGSPSSAGETNLDILDKVLVYNYFDQISVGVKDEVVVFIQTFPVVIEN